MVECQYKKSDKNPGIYNFCSSIIATLGVNTSEWSNYQLLKILLPAQLVNLLCQVIYRIFNISTDRDDVTENQLSELYIVTRF